MLGGPPRVSSQSEVLGAQAKVLFSLLVFWCFQGGSTALVALLVAASTCHWLILSGHSSQMSFKRWSSGCKILPSRKYVSCIHQSCYLTWFCELLNRPYGSADSSHYKIMRFQLVRILADLLETKTKSCCLS